MNEAVNSQIVGNTEQVQPKTEKQYVIKTRILTDKQDGSPITGITPCAHLVKSTDVMRNECRAFRLDSSTIALIMPDTYAEVIYENGFENFDGCNDWKPLEDAFGSVSIGKRDFRVEVRVVAAQICDVSVEARDSSEAEELALDLVRECPDDYIHAEYMEIDDIEAWDCWEE
jgi:hypothetical protein